MVMIMPLMAGKRGLIMGVANERSIAWGIARALHDHGATLAFTYQGEALGKRVRPLAQSLDSNFVVEADVASAESLDSLFTVLARRWERLDFLVHAIAFSDKDELKGKYLQTTRANFLRTLEISCYSFTDVCRRAAPLMTEGGSLLTLTYSGAERVMPHYNVMGIAKAALEASVRYLAVDLGGDKIRVGEIRGRSTGTSRTQRSGRARIRAHRLHAARSRAQPLPDANRIREPRLLRPPVWPGQAERKARIDGSARSTGLDPFPGRPAGKLSGGMKQKLSLCCSLIHDPDS